MAKRLNRTRAAAVKVSSTVSETIEFTHEAKRLGRIIWNGFKSNLRDYNNQKEGN